LTPDESTVLGCGTGSRTDLAIQTGCVGGAYQCVGDGSLISGQPGMVHPKANAHWQVWSSASAVDMCRARKGVFRAGSSRWTQRPWRTCGERVFPWAVSGMRPTASTEHGLQLPSTLDEGRTVRFEACVLLRAYVSTVAWPRLAEAIECAVERARRVAAGKAIMSSSPSPDPLLSTSTTCPSEPVKHSAAVVRLCARS
jgi:hypothetical protein